MDFSAGTDFWCGRRPGTSGTALPAGTARSGTCSGLTLIRQCFFDREIDSPIFGGQDPDLDGLPGLEEIVNIFHEGISDFRDMYQSGTASLQRDECAKLSDSSDLAFQNAPNLRLHTVSCFSFR